MTKKMLKWTLIIGIEEDCVADGVDLSSHYLAKLAIERAFPMLAGAETDVKVDTAPNPAIIAALQGYSSAGEYKASIK